MRFKALRVVSGSEVELTFEGDDGTPVVHLLSVAPAGKPFEDDDVMLVNGDHVFWAHRKLVGDLAAQAQRVAARTIPAGEALTRLAEEARAARKAAWDAAH
jgi:hypothetical protein